jgi:hypothetical protein
VGALSQRIEQPGHEADHSLYVMLRLRINGDIPPSPLSSWHVARLSTWIILPSLYLISSYLLYKL